MKRHVTAIYDRPEDARAATEALVNAGFARDDLSLVMTEGTREAWFPERQRATTGSTLAGTVLGALAGGLIALAGIPGGVLVAGPFAVALGAAGAGAVGGGLLGALVGLGIPKEEARDYQRSLGQGGVLVGVAAHDAKAADRARRILEDAGAGHHPTRTELD